MRVLWTAKQIVVQSARPIDLGGGRPLGTPLLLELILLECATGIQQPSKQSLLSLDDLFVDLASAEVPSDLLGLLRHGIQSTQHLTAGPDGPVDAFEFSGDPLLLGRQCLKPLHKCSGNATRVEAAGPGIELTLLLGKLGELLKSLLKTRPRLSRRSRIARLHEPVDQLVQTFARALPQAGVDSLAPRPVSHLLEQAIERPFDITDRCLK